MDLATKTLLKSYLIAGFAVVMALTVLIVVLLFRSDGSYTVSGSSMSPTLEDGDRIKISQQNDSPKTGDIVVFEKDLGMTRIVLVKRVVAESGDEVEYDDGFIVNGESVSDHECDIDFSQTLGEGEYLVQGDNSDNSSDSLSDLCNGEDGIVDDDDVIAHGKVVDVE